jgi:hypothetical protein
MTSADALSNGNKLKNTACRKAKHGNAIWCELLLEVKQGKN